MSDIWVLLIFSCILATATVVCMLIEMFFWVLKNIFSLFYIRRNDFSMCVCLCSRWNVIHRSSLLPFCHYLSPNAQECVYTCMFMAVSSFSVERHTIIIQELRTFFLFCFVLFSVFISFLDFIWFILCTNTIVTVGTLHSSTSLISLFGCKRKINFLNFFSSFFPPRRTNYGISHSMRFIYFFLF